MVSPPGNNSVVSYKDSWEDCSKCMCTLSETNIHWGWRNSSGGTKFSNILSISANKNGEKSTILNLIQMTGKFTGFMGILL